MDALDDLFDRYDQGVMNRRQLLGALALLTGGAFGANVGVAAQEASPVVASAVSLNHVHVEVTNLKRSVDWYGSVFGCKPLTAKNTVTTMKLPGSTPAMGQWLSITEVHPGDKPRMNMDERGDKVPEYSHIGIGLKSNDFTQDLPRIAAEYRKRYPNLKAPNYNPTADQSRGEVYLFDPDGNAIQLIPVAHEGDIDRKGKL